MHKTTQNTIMLTRARTKYQARAIATIALHTWASTETWAADRSARGAAMPSSGAQARPQRAGSSSSLLLPPQNTAAPTSSPRAAAEACAPAEMAESHEYSARSDLAADSTLAGRGLPGCRPVLTSSSHRSRPTSHFMLLRRAHKNFHRTSNLADAQGDYHQGTSHDCCPTVLSNPYPTAHGHFQVQGFAPRKTL